MAFEEICKGYKIEKDRLAVVLLKSMYTREWKKFAELARNDRDRLENEKIK
jgi:hypothetical protein